MNAYTTSWLVEKRDPTEFLGTGPHFFEWVMDARQALRFAREEDADRVKEIIAVSHWDGVPDDIHSCEHMWYEPVPESVLCGRALTSDPSIAATFANVIHHRNGSGKDDTCTNSV